jgi:hypothetical protein
MRRTKVSHLTRIVALGVGILFLTWGVGADVSDAQHHDDHGTTTTTAGPGSTTTTTRTPPAPGAQTKVVRYGPYTAQGAPPSPDGHGHGVTTPGLGLNVEKPCTNCYITRMVPDLVYADGRQAGHNTNTMLHHLVLANRQTDRSDATCANSGTLGLVGQRFFASGDERAVVEFPPNFGYKIGADSMWVLIWELANMQEQPQSLFFQVTFEYVPDSTPGMKEVEPVWFDADQCGTSHVAIPAGPTTAGWNWTVNRPGEIVSVFNHLHDYGSRIEIRNEATGQLVCEGRAGYGESPLYVDSHGMQHISSMSSCVGTAAQPGLGTVANGQRVTMTGHYDAPNPVEDAMVISVAYIGQGGGSPSAGCSRALNSAHVQAGRATTWLIFAWAKGSNQYLGLTWATTSLREGPAGTWTMVTAC